jgi:solute carrier family 39 (zinc transporter), member 1/2/3
MFISYLHAIPEFWLKTLAAVGIFLLAMMAGYPRLKKNPNNATTYSGHNLHAISSGIFLGTSLLHLLPESQMAFVAYDQSSHYPWGFLLAGLIFLFLLCLEHITIELEHDHQGAKKSIGLTMSMMFVILIMHALFEGMALGFAKEWVAVTLVLAILAHKWTESFALSNMLDRSQWTTTLKKICFLIFVLTTPLGMMLAMLLKSPQTNPILQATCNAMAAGTFLYIGTLHGLKRSIMVDRCCNIKEFFWLLFGFVVMAFLAIWL